MAFSMASLMLENSPFSIKSEIKVVFNITSHAGVRVPSRVRSKRCETMALSAAAKSPSMVGRTSTG